MSPRKVSDDEAVFHTLSEDDCEVGRERQSAGMFIAPGVNPKTIFTPGDVLEIKEPSGLIFNLNLESIVLRKRTNSWYVCGYESGKNGLFFSVPVESVLRRIGRWEERSSIPFRDLTARFSAEAVTDWVTATTTNREIHAFAARTAREVLWERWERLEDADQPLPRTREITAANDKLMRSICIACRAEMHRLKALQPALKR